MIKSIGLLLAGMLAGVALMLVMKNNNPFLDEVKANPKNTTFVPSGTLQYPVKATLYRFKLNKNNMAVYHEWVKWHYDAYNAMIESLERERMYFECVFRDTLNSNDSDEIYWLAINGEGGETSSTSSLAIDKKHIEYMKQILVKGSRTTLKTEFTLLPNFIEESIAKHQASGKK